MLIYFLRGNLPWRKIRAPNTPPPQSSFSSSNTPSSSRSDPLPRTQSSHKQAPNHQKHQRHYNPISATWDLIRDAKLEAEPHLTLGLPPEFDVLYRYARGLEFDDLPDYEGLKVLFRGLAERVGVEYDGFFDWSVPSPSPSLGASKAGGSGGRRAVSEGHRGRFCEACRKKRRQGTGGDVEKVGWR